MRTGFIVLTTLLLCACSDPRELRMRRSFEHAQAQLHQAQIEPFAANRLRNAMEISGTPVDYLIADQPSDTDLGPYRWQSPQQGFDVVINGNEADWQIDGYGESLEAPIASVHVQREPE